MLTIGIVGAFVVLCGFVLALRLRHDASRLRARDGERGVFDEREAASRLRVRTGSVEVQPRTPPVEP